ncbi:MAG: phosphatase [Candidatus Peribacteria bacterium]|nr:phosphatase [Candidatus Peribacteria bacterium]
MKYDIKKYKAIVFDFDGVILDSEQFKIATFKSLFTEYPNHLEAIDSYNKQNRGISRYEKFAHIFKNILDVPYTEETGKELGKKYSNILSQNLAATPLIEGVNEFLIQQSALLFIASSSEVHEMEIVLQTKGMTAYFVKLYGHPILKAEAITKTMEEYHLEPSQLLFFGDAIADWKVAHETNVNFIARTENPELFPTDTNNISTFLELLVQG